MQDDLTSLREKVKELLSDYKRTSTNGSRLKMFNTVFDIEYDPTKILLNNASSENLLELADEVE